MELEKLLNKLIEKGWKPFGWEEVREAKKWRYNNLCYWFDSHPELYHIRRLVSIESWLWQFVCENKLLEPDHMREYNWYEYWIIQSALCDEEDLEKFLLDNIKL